MKREGECKRGFRESLAPLRAIHFFAHARVWRFGCLGGCLKLKICLMWAPLLLKSIRRFNKAIDNQLCRTKILLRPQAERSPLSMENSPCRTTRFCPSFAGTERGATSGL